jgi:hypothetical protein
MLNYGLGTSTRNSSSIAFLRKFHIKHMTPDVESTAQNMGNSCGSSLIGETQSFMNLIDPNFLLRFRQKIHLCLRPYLEAT